MSLPFRTRAVISASAVAMAAGALLAPAALAAPAVSHGHAQAQSPAQAGPAQVTGQTLKGGLLAPASILPGYTTIFASNSGGRLEHGTVFRIPALKCSAFWGFIGTVKGFGESAFATETAASTSAGAPVAEIFQQSVYQFASTRTATAFYGQVGARYKSCKSVAIADGHGGQLEQTVRSRTTERVGGHPSLLLAEILTDTKIGGPPVVTEALWTLDGPDVYLFNSQLLSVKAPKPTLSSLMLKLIPRVRALK